MTDTPATPKNPLMPAAGLDDIDLAILAQLAANARITNAALAAHVGVAESTSIKRLRALRASGIITGFTAQLNLAALGFPIRPSSRCACPATTGIVSCSFTPPSPRSPES